MSKLTLFYNFLTHTASATMLSSPLIDEDRCACPRETVVYTCCVASSSLQWDIVTPDRTITRNLAIGDLEVVFDDDPFEFIATNHNGTHLFATATVTGDAELNNTAIMCTDTGVVGGGVPFTETLCIAGECTCIV